MDLYGIKRLILDDLEDFGIMAEVQLESDFITTMHNAIFVGFHTNQDYHYYKLAGKIKETSNIIFEVI